MENKKTKKTIITIAVLAGLILVTGLAIILINSTKKKGPAGFGKWGGFGGGSATVTSVQSVVAEKSTMHDYVNTNGDIETQRSIEVYSSISGKVVQVDVSLGSHVEAGDVIGYVDSSAVGVNYKWSPITAPISGSIIQTPVKTGQQISTATVFTKIGDIENLQVSASIPERFVGDLKPGLKAEITLEAYPGVVFPATVVRVSPVLDASSRTKQVILNFDQNDSRINAGMFAKVKLYTVDYKDSISIAQDALVTVREKYYLYVINKETSTVDKKEVTLGKNVNGYYQITSGIEVGDVVVTAGMLTLSQDSKVKDISGNVPYVEEEKKDGKTGEGMPGGFPGKGGEGGPGAGGPGPGGPGF